MQRFAAIVWRTSVIRRKKANRSDVKGMRMMSSLLAWLPSLSQPNHFRLWHASQQLAPRHAHMVAQHHSPHAPRHPASRLTLFFVPRRLFITCQCNLDRVARSSEPGHCPLRMSPKGVPYFGAVITLISSISLVICLARVILLRIWRSQSHRPRSKTSPVTIISLDSLIIYLTLLTILNQP